MYPHNSGPPAPAPAPNQQHQWSQPYPQDIPPQHAPNAAAHGAPNGYHPAHLPSIQPPPSTMAVSPYHLPAPHRQHNMYPHVPQQYPYPPPTQPAPRQRTAIACSYCRRRKIRCSGFENSEDGRCSNCSRFSQECVFTPVSATTHAFVPAQSVFGRGAHPPPGTQLYGAYGQPLPRTHPVHDAYGRGAPQPYPMASPTGPYPGPPGGYVPAPAPLDTRNAAYSRKRPSDEPHTPVLAPPPPGASRPEHDYRYPDPTTLAPSAGAVSPASSSASFHSAPQSANQQTPYYTQPPPSTGAYPQPPMHAAPRRPSPTNSAYNYDASRASSSPHNQPQPGTPAYGGDSTTLRPPSNAPQSRTPPPPTSGVNGTAQPATNGAGPRPGMSISSIVSGQANGNGSQASNDGASPGAARSAADSDMLNRLR